jgi:hypothetical protein
VDDAEGDPSITPFSLVANCSFTGVFVFLFFIFQLFSGVRVHSLGIVDYFP